MDSFQVAQIALQANAVGKSHGVFCIYKWDGESFAWIFYRKNPMGNIRLGKTTDPKQVIKRMEKYVA